LVIRLSDSETRLAEKEKFRFSINRTTTYPCDDGADPQNVATAIRFGESHEISYCSADKRCCGNCPGTGAVSVHHHHYKNPGRRQNYHNLVRRIIGDDDELRWNEYDNLSPARLSLYGDGSQWI
jgi:hypothetical protein